MRNTLALALMVGLAVPVWAQDDQERIEVKKEVELEEEHRVETEDASETGGVSESAERDKVRSRVPLVYKYERENDHEEFGVLRWHILDGIEYERHGDHSDFELLDIPFASVIKAEDHGPYGSQMRFINAPATSVVRTESSDGGNRFRLLKLPWMYLLSTESHEDGDYEHGFLKLPLVGPLFKVSKDGDKRETRFLFFFRHRSGKDSEPQVRHYRPDHHLDERDWEAEWEEHFGDDWDKEKKEYKPLDFED